MRVLWAPWRMSYILGPKPESCVLCQPPRESFASAAEMEASDHERLVLYRGQAAYVVMNKFPYSNGHLLIAPLRHVSDLVDLAADESAECMALMQSSISILRQFCSPQGINMGLNLGEAAGAGIRQHLHFHLVPRWNGDSSFMAVLDEVRVIPEHLEESYLKLKPLFDQLKKKTA